MLRCLSFAFLALALLLGAPARAEDGKLASDKTFQFNLGSGFNWGLGVAGTAAPPKTSNFSFGSIDWTHLPFVGGQTSKRYDFAMFNDLGHGPRLTNDGSAFSTTVDLFVNRDFMTPTQSGTSAAYGLGSYWMWQPTISPGVQAYGDLAQFSSEGMPKYADQHRIGPALGGSLDLGFGSPINWNLAYMFGLNSNTESGSLKAGFDYELPF